MPSTSAAPSIGTSDGYDFPDESVQVPGKKGRKWWNPFRRKRHQQSTTPDMPSVQPSEPAGMPVSIATGPMSRSIPYYAVMESESENNTTEAIGQFLSQAIESPPPSPEPPLDTSTTRYLRRRTESILLPTAPVWSEAIGPPTPSLSYRSRADSPTDDNAAGRQPRLHHIGRIPKVVNRTERQHVPSPTIVFTAFCQTNDNGINASRRTR